MRFKSTYGRTQHIYAKHSNLGIDEPESPSRSDDMNRGHRIDSSPSSYTSQLDQADERTMVIDPPPIVSDDFVQPPITYSPFPSPPPFASDGLLTFLRSQSPADAAVHPHDGNSDTDNLESTGHSQANSPILNDSEESLQVADTADELATCTITDYHLVLNGKFIYSISYQGHCTD